MSKAVKNNVWISLIYLTQFPMLRQFVNKLAIAVNKGENIEFVMKLHKFMKKIISLRRLKDKVLLVIKT